VTNENVRQRIKPPILPAEYGRLITVSSVPVDVRITTDSVRRGFVAPLVTARYYLPRSGPHAPSRCISHRAAAPLPASRVSLGPGQEPRQRKPFGVGYRVEPLYLDGGE
jgi:hypothetical protein